MNPIRHIDYENLSELNLPFRKAYESVFHELLEKGWFILGSETAAFEKEFAAYLGSPYMLGLASGLDALEIPLKILDFPEGSEVIVPSNTYIATVNAVLNAGFRPVFAEADIRSYTIDPERVEEKITPRTKAIIVVHLYGKPCEMDPILHLCRKHDLALIEDCAQSHGARYRGKATGTFGFGAFSFYPTKNLGALGDGGGISVADEAIYQKLRAWRNYGSHIKYKNEYIGDNSRLDEIQAAFLRIKLAALDDINAHKRKLANLYFELLDENKFILPERKPYLEEVYHIFPVRHKKRDALREYMLLHGIKTEVHYPIAPCDQDSVRNFFNKKGWKLDPADFELAREIHATILSLPVSTIHSEEDVRHIAAIMNAFQE
jgi:dTDP-4-amino-4,6-dideoxygalactose transaminase